MKKVTDIRSKLTPAWIEKGKAALDSLSEQDQEYLVAFMFNLILTDVKMGLKGEEAEVFFEMIDDEFRKAHAGCYFGIETDGNEVNFTKETKLCLICAVKVNNILRAFGYKVNEPMVPGRLLH